MQNHSAEDSVQHGWPTSRLLRVTVIATALPLCAYIAGTIYQDFEHDKSQSEASARAVADSAAAVLRQTLREVEHTVRVLAERPQVRAMAAHACQPLFQALLPLLPVYANVSLVDLERRVICSAVEDPAGTIRIPLHSALARAFAGEFGVSEPLMGVLPQKLVVSVGYPVRDAAGAIAGAVTTPVDLAQLDPLRGPLRVAEGVRVLIVDAAGVLIASSLRDDPRLGTGLTGAMAAAMRGAGGASFRMSGPDGVERVWAGADVGTQSWRAYAGVPVDALRSRALVQAGASSALAAITLAVALFAAASVARHIAGPARAIQRAMDAIAAGRNVHAPVGGPHEIRELARNFNRMLDARMQAERSLRENEARLRLAVAASHIGLWDWDVPRNAVYLSREWKLQLGYAEGELEDRYVEWESRLHPEERGHVLAKLAHLLASSESHFDCEYRLRHRDGSFRWVHSRAEITRAPDGTPLRMIGTHVDTTRRKTLEGELRGLSSRLMVAEENERKAIGRELHDRIGANLAAMQISLGLLAERLESGPREEARKLLADARDAVATAHGEIRAIIADLRPPALDDFGVYVALRAYAAGIASRLGIAFEMTPAEGLPRPPPAVETALFRIAQEALTNVLKHARARRLSMEVTLAGETLTLAIADDGVGFDLAAQGAGGHGLRTMRERADAVGANFSVEARPGQGARVVVSVQV